MKRLIQREKMEELIKAIKDDAYSTRPLVQQKACDAVRSGKDEDLKSAREALERFDQKVMQATSCVGYIERYWPTEEIPK